MSRRTLPLLLLAGAAPVALPACNIRAEADGNAQVPLAVAMPISGPLSHFGKDVVNGVRMALDEINATQPVIGGQPVQFRLLVEDDAGEPRQATTVAQKLCDAGAVAVIGHLQSGTSIPASGIYNRCGMVQITPAATSPDYTKSGYRTAFRLIANDDQLGQALVGFAAKSGVKTVALVDDRTSFGQGLAGVFKRASKKHGMRVVSTEFTNDKATDFMAILTSIKSKKPDAILYAGLGVQAGLMLRQMDQLGMSRIKFFGGDAICTEKLPELASQAKAMGNVICATGGRAIGKMNDGAAWKKRYDEKFPGELQIYGPHGYAATDVLVQAMKQAGSTDPKVYLPALAAIEYTALTGPVAFTPTGELTQAAVTLYAYRDGKRIEKESLE